MKINSVLSTGRNVGVAGIIALASYASCVGNKNRASLVEHEISVQTAYNLKNSQLDSVARKIHKAEATWAQADSFFRAETANVPLNLQKRALPAIVKKFSKIKLK